MDTNGILAMRYKNVNCQCTGAKDCGFARERSYIMEHFELAIATDYLPSVTMEDIEAVKSLICDIEQYSAALVTNKKVDLKKFMRG